jgi:hypothetical protein
LADVEHCSHLKVKSGDDRVFVGRKGGWGRRRWHALTGSCSRLLQGDGLGLLLKEEVGGLDAIMGSGGLRLGVLSLEPSTEGSSLGVIRHGDRTGLRTSGG